MVIGQSRRAVGLFSGRQDAENALYRLRDAGFNMDKVSVVAKNTGASDNIAGARIDHDKDDQIKGGAGAGATAGAATGGLLGLFGSLGVLAIPGVGPAAEIGIVLANTLLGGGIGAAGGGLIGALIGWGVPEDRAKYYNSRVSEGGDYMVMVEGTEQDIRNAEGILSSYGIRDWETFDTPMTGDRSGTTTRY
jgi:hypothetical protein